MVGEVGHRAGVVLHPEAEGAPTLVLQVECPVLEIPEHVRVNIEKLTIGTAIHVKELELPPGVKILDDPDLVVVQVKQQQVQVVEPVVAAAPTAEGAPAAEPEVITKKKEKPAEEEE